MRFISRADVPPLRRKRSSVASKAPKPAWTVKKWTTVISASGEHEVWPVLDSAGHPVAFGSETKMKEHALKLRESGGVLFS